MTGLSNIDICNYIRTVQVLHCQQVDKIGESYWEHPVRVMTKLPFGVYLPDTYYVALFHDVLEDTDQDSEYLKNVLKLSPNAVEMIETLTKPKQMSYNDYIKNICTANFNNIKKDIDLILVKMCDIWDNLDITRLKQIDNKTQNRLLKKYLPAMDHLIDTLNNKLNDRGVEEFVDYPTLSVMLNEINRLTQMYKYHQI